MKSVKFSIILIICSFILSIFFTNYNLKNFDKHNITNEGKTYHQMIKSDPYWYLSDGYSIKQQLKNGLPFFRTGPENYTKYLPSRIAAIYYYIFDYEFYEEISGQKIVKTGIHNIYLYFQCFFYFFSLLIFAKSIHLKIKNSVASNATIFFLSLEPTIFQYHSSFWSESYFFSFQILLLAFMLKKPNIKNLIIVGCLLGVLSLQKQLAFFYIIPILIYYFFIIKQDKIIKIPVIFISYFLILCILGLNNFGRSGKFSFLTADTKINFHLYLIEKVIMKKLNITGNEFRIREGKVMYEWIKNNNIEIDNSKLEFEKNYSYFYYRDLIVHEEDKIMFDKIISSRTIKYFKKYPIDSLIFVLKSAIHTLLLNPFHIYSDNNFRSGEIYYTTEVHDKLVLYRVPYTFIIYLICLFGFINLLKQKNYQLLSLYLISIVYFYSLVMWHGNTRYFVPNLIYLSLFFGYGFSFLKKKIDNKF